MGSVRNGFESVDTYLGKVGKWLKEGCRGSEVGGEADFSVDAI
jgi:hypothetical protein